MNFGAAIEAMKAGGRMTRAGWNGKGMFVYINMGSYPADAARSSSGLYNGVSFDLFDNGHFGTTVRMPNFNMHTADGSTITGWLASQTDMLAEDWEVAV